MSGINLTGWDGINTPEGRVAYIQSHDPLTVFFLISEYNYTVDQITFTQEFLRMRKRQYKVDQVLEYRKATDEDQEFLNKYYLDKYEYILPKFDHVAFLKVSDPRGFWSFESDFPSSVISSYTLRIKGKEIKITQETSFCKSCKSELGIHNHLYCDTCYNFAVIIYKEENKISD